MANSKRALSDRLKDITPAAPSMMPQAIPGLVKQTYNMSLFCTEKQLDHVKSHLRMLRIKFEVSDEESS